MMRADERERVYLSQLRTLARGDYDALIVPYLGDALQMHILWRLYLPKAGRLIVRRQPNTKWAYRIEVRHAIR